MRVGALRSEYSMDSPHNRAARKAVLKSHALSVPGVFKAWFKARLSQRHSLLLTLGLL